MLANFIRVFMIVACASTWTIRALAQANTQVDDLATRYVELRLYQLQNSVSLGGSSTASIAPELLDQIVQDVARNLKRSPEWNSAHPAWKRAVETIRRDLAELIAQAEKDSATQRLQENVRLQLAVGIQTRLTAEELRRILLFYESPVGKHFLGQQVKMLDVLESSLLEMQRRMFRGEQISPDPQIDKILFEEVLTLFDETVRGMWALLDPGPGKDRSGLQAIPMLVTTGVQSRFREISDLWRDLSSDERGEVLVFRSSPLGRKERIVLSEAVGQIKGQLKNSDLQKLLESKGVELEQKWRGLVPK